MESFLDTDFYKITQMQFVFEHYPNTPVTYKFIDRNKTRIADQFSFLSKFKEKLDQIASHTITSYELLYLESLGYFKPAYLGYLSQFKFNKSDILPWFDDGVFQIGIKGNWLNTILWEVPLLGVAAQLYADLNSSADINNQYRRICDKRFQMKGLSFCEFGTRRRRNFDYQKVAVEILKESPNFVGTSNVHLARTQGVKPLGTIAHEVPMALSAKVGLVNANKETMMKWVETYQGKLGIALTDTLTTDVFLRSFDGVYARLFDGVRQDSGPPVSFAHKINQHYISLGINPAYKTVLFSDGLNPLKCQEIEKELDSFNIKLNSVFALGTDFSNDQKLNLVIKLSTVDGKPVCKLSDEIGKSCGESQAINYIKDILDLW